MAVTGIGGIFFRAKDPDALGEWYRKHLGVFAMDADYEPWTQAAGPTVFSPFPADTGYFGSTSQNFMINFRVDDLDNMLMQLKADGVVIVKDAEDQENVGRFASIEDPEGNRIELWQPEA
jgi:glyoxylase I family protein